MKNANTRTGPGRALIPLMLVLACTKPGLEGSSGALRFEKASMDFGSVYADGRERVLTASLANDGRASLDVTWGDLVTPFTLVAPARVQSGSTEFTIAFKPSAPGHFSRKLTVLADANTRAELFIEGVARPIPQCVPSSTCTDAHFDLNTEKCVEVAKPDGLACDPRTLCITAATCAEGRCVGTEVTCNDSNACTVDVCNALTGCEFLPAPPCPGDGACQVGTCSPTTGCALAAAPDGTTCGTLQTCKAAQICITGNCVVRDPPDGYVCAEASPCSGEGRCVADECVKAPGSPLVASWTLDTTSSNEDAGIPRRPQHDFVMEPTGELSLTSFFASPARIRANSSQARDTPEGSLRRCVLWNGRLVCADYPSNPNGRVSAIDPATGQRVWTFDVRTARPDFVALTSQIFLARLVVQSSDRLAAIYESYPANPPVTGTASSQCRAYFLVVLDASGHLVMAQQLTDPLIGLCNHPHPYGVASDSVGNLFIAFSPTRSAQAPLKPDSPVLMMSFTHDGLFRWKKTDPTMVGGELSIARGLLYPENSTVALTAATGVPSFSLPGPIGRVVISDARMVPSPAINSSAISGYEAGQAALRWTHQLPPQSFFQSDQIRLAAWNTSHGTRTVALTVVQDLHFEVPTQFLRAINVHDGSEAFTCELPMHLRTAAQLMEVANGSLGLMSDAFESDNVPACGKCDPPFAGSAGTFYTVPLPSISVAVEPWVGTFGGADHDHHEDAVIISPVAN